MALGLTDETNYALQWIKLFLTVALHLDFTILAKEFYRIFKMQIFVAALNDYINFKLTGCERNKDWLQFSILNSQIRPNAYVARILRKVLGFYLQEVLFTTVIFMKENSAMKKKTKKTLMASFFLTSGFVKNLKRFHFLFLKLIKFNLFLNC